MIFSKACPRCDGAVIDYDAPLLDGPLCLNCGWRAAEPSADLAAVGQSVKPAPGGGANRRLHLHRAATA